VIEQFRRISPDRFDRRRDGQRLAVAIEDRTARHLERDVAQIAGVALLLVKILAHDLQVDVVDGFLGPAKGVRSPEGDAAAKLVARTEGVFLDPVFAAKAMAGLLAAAADGAIEGPVVFLVSGGAPTLFTV